MNPISQQPVSIDKNVKRAIFASTLGTIIEWYDYGLYAAASGLIINKLFFPQLSQLGGMLEAFATFAIGFIIRPVGGIVISHIGDKFGRKPELILPTWHSIGIWAPILLIFLRILQGFGAGAELAGAITLVVEYTPVKRRGFFTVIPNTATNFGVLIATVTFLFFSWLPEETLLGWVWRISFQLSVLLFVIALYIRAKLDETPEYVNAIDKAQRKRQQQKAPIRQLFKESPRELLCGFFAMGGHQALTYVLNTFALSYMINTLGMSKTDDLMVLIIAFTFTLICGPIGGWLADRYGSTKIFICGALFFCLPPVLSGRYQKYFISGAGRKRHL